MPIETPNNISELDPDWPLPEDKTNEGDDHIRNFKLMMQLQFPGALGGGFDEPIIATEQELNWLAGLTDNVQDQLTALDARIDALEGVLSAESGTTMVFYQASAPSGWQQYDDTILNDHMMRVVDTAGGAVGGTDSAILNDKVPSHTHTTDSAGATTFLGNFIASNAGGTQVAITTGATPWYSYNIPSIPAHTHTAEANAGAANWEPKYMDVIVCVKT